MNPTHSDSHWYCEACGAFDGPKSDDVCDVCADDGVRYFVAYMAPARDDERGKLFELQNLLSGPGDPASLVADALYYLAAPTAETDAVVAENEKLRGLLRRAYRICGPDDLARDIEEAVPDV